MTEGFHGLPASFCLFIFICCVTPLPTPPSSNPSGKKKIVLRQSLNGKGRLWLIHVNVWQNHYNSVK